MVTPEKEKSTGTLTLVSTPIGNLGDITARALDVLRSVDAVLAEDTRHSGMLLVHFGIRQKLIAYHDHNKERVTPGILDRLLSGENIALVSDAGTPAVSDPGFFITRAAIEAGIPVTVVPGANAILPALVMSGFPTDKFVFEGFLPRKSGELARWIEELASEHRTVIYFVSPHQLVKVLRAFAERLPGREMAVVREITKIHEEVVRGTARDLLRRYEGGKVRGEIVLVVKAGEPAVGARLRHGRLRDQQSRRGPLDGDGAE
jgi:16S rRNA (cytidine1402-2'-O)-methyltransferase